MSTSVGTKIGQWLTSAKVRTSILFFAGLGLTIREALMNGPDRPLQLGAWMGMMGFSIVDIQTSRTSRRDQDEDRK